MVVDWPNFATFKIVFDDRKEFNEAMDKYKTTIMDIGHCDMIFTFDDKGVRDGVAKLLEHAGFTHFVCT